MPAFIDPLRRRLPRPVSIPLIVIAGISGGLLVFWRWDWLLDKFGWPAWLHLDATIRVAATVVSGMVVVLAAVRLLHPTAISRLRVATGRRLSRTSLLTAILLAVGVGVGLAVLFNWAIGEFAGLKAEETPRIEVTRTALAGVAGIGGAVALVVAYRRQRDIEQGRFVERFGAAAAQLGDHDVAVRIAGVYAMAGVADESTGLRRQQCIDVLCGYLRLPYDPELGSNHRTKLVLTEPRTGDDGSPLGQQEEQLEYRQNDKEVRATIVRVITRHLRDHEYSWSACDFDFRTAHLEDVQFHHAVFGGSTRFDGATFSGVAWFAAATFSDAWFEAATFSGPAGFDKATFSDPTSFGAATFSGPAGFNAATFPGHARFDKATFSGPARFDKATFSGPTRFDKATFSGPTSFDKATFSGPTSFAGTDFGSGAIEFENPRQWGPPAPTFDWDGDLSTKPENVTPQNWPPTPVA